MLGNTFTGVRSALSILAAFVLYANTGLVNAQSLSIENYQLISKTRVSKSDKNSPSNYEYVYRADVKNSGSSAYGVNASVTSSSRKVIVVDNSLTFGLVLAGQTVTSSDTFAIRAKKNFDKRINKSDDDDDKKDKDDKDDKDDDKNSFSVLSWKINYQSDNSAPTISGQAPKDIFTSNATPLISAQYQDANSGIDSAATRLELDGSNVTSGATVTASSIQYQPSAALAEGVHTVKLTVKDRLGNTAQASWSFTVDTLSPVISGQTPAEGSYAPTRTPLISAQYQDANGIDRSKVSLKLNGTDISLSATITDTGISYQATAPLQQGSHTVLLTVVDKAGNSTQSTWRFLIDVTPPVISGETPKDITVPTITPTLSAQFRDDETGIDTARTVVKLDGIDVTALAGVTATGFTYALTTPLLAGSHQVALTVYDKAGNMTQSSWSFAVDTTPPVISNALPLNNSYQTNQSPLISAQIADAESGIDTTSTQLLLDNVDITATASITATTVTYQTNNLSQGLHQLSLKVYDKAGNLAQAQWQFTVDTLPPVISGETPKDVYLTSTTQSLSAQYLDADSGIDTVRTVLTLNGVDVTAASTVTATGITYPLATTLLSGVHQVVLTVYDMAGNQAQSSWSFSVDATPPVISAQLPVNNTYVTITSPVISVLYADDGSGLDISRIKLLFDNVDVSTVAVITASSISYQTSNLAQGQHQVVLKVYDMAGNPAESAWQFTVDSLLPVISGETPKDVVLTSGSNVTISALFQDNLSGIAATNKLLMLDGFDITSQATFVESGLTYHASSLEDGEHGIYLKLMDRAGNQAESLWYFTVTIPSTYSLVLTSPQDGVMVSEGIIQVVGSASASKASITAVSVNSMAVALVQNTDGSMSFDSSLRLVEGSNVILVVAQYSDGQSRSVTSTVNYNGPPVVTITSPYDMVTFGPVNSSSPRNLTGLVDRPVTVTGSVSKDVVSVSVNQQEAVLAGRDFTFTNFFLHEGTNFVTVVATDASGRTGTSTITVSVDQTAPILAIESPINAYVTSQNKIDVRGLVNDAVEGLVGDAEPVVSVNGVTARVGDRYFIATGVPLNVGGNTLTVTATDQVGNTRTATVNVTRIQVGSNRLSVIGGNNQTGAINTELLKPLTAIALDAQGQPLANMALTFDMLRGTGGIAATQGGVTSRNLQVTTDSTGQASVYFTTGKQSGFANNVVRVKSVDIPEDVLFYATAQAGTPTRISSDMLGTNQRAETGAKVLEPLVAIVSDNGDNRVAGVSVTFKIEEGDATFDGQQQVTLLTDKNGIASARPTMGLDPGKCRITATVDQVGATAFIVTSLAASNQPTGFSGVVLNDRNQPLPGATLSIGRTTLTATTDAQGKFTFDANVPAGKIDLFVDGRTATGLTEVYPALHFEVLAVRGQVNELPHPIFMPPLNTPETKIVGGDQDVVLRIPGFEGFSMKVFANSVTFPDGTKTGPLVVSRVNQDKLPMVPPGGASIFMAPAWTIQPASTRFDPPIQVTIPNSQGLKPGESNTIYQWDHDLATFVPIGRATVNEDASFLISDAGSGVTKAGWGGGPPPPPPPTCTKPNSDCKDCKKFDASPAVCGCVADTSVNGSKCDDKDKCTADDKCTGGSCKGEQIKVKITASSATICVNRSKSFKAESTPVGQAISWSGTGGVLVGSGGTVTGVTVGRATVKAYADECTKASDTASVKVMDKVSSAQGPGQILTCLFMYSACSQAEDIANQIDPAQDQGVPTWISQNFKSVKNPGDCRANREGSEMDAATHAVLSCELNRQLGEANAKKILDSHEAEHPEDTCESHEQDYNNNEIGKELSKATGDCGTLALDALNNGRLQVNRPYAPGVCVWTGNGL